MPAPPLPCIAAIEHRAGRHASPTEGIVGADREHVADVVDFEDELRLLGCLFVIRLVLSALSIGRRVGGERHGNDRKQNVEAEQ
jgi:hypothetical protein